MKKSLFLTLIFFTSLMSPIAAAGVTETQFSDGSTSYTHTFTGSGDGFAGNLTFPYGAEVSSATFDIAGEPSSTTWGNMTTNTDFGGEGTSNWVGIPPGFAYGSRYNLEVTNDQVQMSGVMTEDINGLDSSRDGSSVAGVVNNTGGFASNGDQGFIGSTKSQTSFSVSTSSSNYRGFVIAHDDEYHSATYTSTSIYNTPTLKRYNSTTGVYIGTASVSSGSCSYSTPLYSTYDATSDGDGNVWTVSYSYRILVKWSVSSSGAWTCLGTYSTAGNYYPMGVDVDEDSGRLFLLMYDSSSYPNYNRYLYEVDPSNPSSTNGSWLLGSREQLGSSSTQASGLIVNLPKIITNEYYRSEGYHNHFTMDGIFVERNGKLKVDGGGHYGMDQLGDGTFGYQCHYYSYCTSQLNKIQRKGTGAIYDHRTPTTASSTVTSSTQSLSKSITEVTVSGLVGYEPANTSIELEVSNDGGNTWSSGIFNQKIIFTTPGSSIVWKAYLNGTSSETPVLDFVSLTYSTRYQSSGYIQLRSSYYNPVSNAPVAITAFWNATTPAGTGIQVEVQDTSTKTFQYSGDSQTISPTTYVYIYVRFTSTGSNTPVLEDLQIAMHSNAPQNVGIDIGGDGLNEWTSQGMLLGTTSRSGSKFVDALNDEIPGTGSGTVSIPVHVSSQSAGIVVLQSFSVTYTINTVNLDINIPEGEILHERTEPYEVITRHIVGDGANNYIQSATLSFLATPASSAPTLEWQDGDIFPSPNDPDDWIEVDQSSWSNLNNGILEIHWLFYVTSNFPDQENVRFVTSCTDTSGSDGGFTPTALSSTSGLKVNNSFGLGWMKVRDNDGEMTSEDVEDGSWVAAGETIHFQGAMWFANSTDAPKDSAFDVRIAMNGYVDAAWRDTSNVNGSFFISVDMPDIDVESGLTYEIQTYNERDSSKVLPSNSDWSRTYKVDATHPEALMTSPSEDDYEAADSAQKISIAVSDAVGDPTELSLYYWVEADHDLNRNGEADPSEYAHKIVTNNTDADYKMFSTTIDHSRNPNMGRVSYYWDGGDNAGNPLHYSTIIDEEEYIWNSGPGFNADDATFRTRKDSSAIFTGLEWEGHNDGAPIFAGTEQTISLGLIDANTAIDFEYIDLVFDFEGPDSEVDQQRISYYGMTDMFASNSEFISLASSSSMVQTTNESGMPLILLDFDFTIGWDWPDEEISDLALEYKERGFEFPTRHIISEHTFRVENDLVLEASSFLVEDISEPRTGIVADGSRVRNDDRLEFTGRVVYEGSNVPAPNDASIAIEVFDGQSVWSDGSISENGEYSVEVPLSHAESLRSSPTRTCLISISGIPGTGEDMTGQTVSTTLRVVVDDTAPRVVSRAAPLNVIDISATTDLTKVPVEFFGTEDADMTGSQQFVHWVMRDSSRTLTLGAGQSVLGMQQDGQNVIWTGTVDLTDGGRITLREGDWVGFYLTGYDSAGNEFPVVSNSEASPISEIATDDTDFERQWVRLGAVGPQLKIGSVQLSDDHVAPGQEIEITADVLNVGGETNFQFKVAFYAGDAIVPFDSVTLNNIGANQKIPVTVKWNAKEGVDRIRVVVDPDDVIVEVNDDDNSAEHKVEIVYVSYMGWFDSIREQPLIWLFSILSIIVLVAIGITANRTAISHSDESLFEEEWDEEEEWEEDEDEEYEDDDDDYDDDY